MGINNPADNDYAVHFILIGKLGGGGLIHFYLTATKTISQLSLKTWDKNLLEIVFYINLSTWINFRKRNTSTIYYLIFDSHFLVELFLLPRYNYLWISYKNSQYLQHKIFEKPVTRSRTPKIMLNFQPPVFKKFCLSDENIVYSCHTKHSIAQVSKDMGPRGTALVTIMPLVDKRLILLRHVDTHTHTHFLNQGN